MEEHIKHQKYSEVLLQLDALLQNETNSLARISTAVCVLKSTFEYYYWCGFYLVDPDKKPLELVIGPYQGTLGCLRIPVGKGVCGGAAETKETKIVDDVRIIENHIACDSRSVSEIVVPWVSDSGELLGVLDIDSLEVGSFSSVDQKNLQSILSLIHLP